MLAEIDTPEPVSFPTLFSKMHAVLNLYVPGKNTEYLEDLHDSLESLERHMTNKAKQIRIYYNNSFLIKMIRLRLSTRYSDKNWGSSWDHLEDTLELFMDRTIPVNFDHYLSKIDSVVLNLPFYNLGFEKSKKIRHSMEHTISRVLARASGQARWETKLNAIKILANRSQNYRMLPTRSPAMAARALRRPCR